MQELSRTTPQQHDQWKAWVVNTQTSVQTGSHWFTVIVGRQLPQSSASASTTGSANEKPRSSPSTGLGTERTASTTTEITGLHTTSQCGSATEHPTGSASGGDYPQLFGATDMTTLPALSWAQANPTDPLVAAWMRAGSEWNWQGSRPTPGFAFFCFDKKQETQQNANAV